MSVAHEVKSTCGKTVTVHGTDLSTYKTAKAWIEDHQSEIKLAFNAISTGTIVISHVRKK